MKVSVRDSKALTALQPLEFGAYLRSKGWLSAEVVPGEYSVWRLEHDEITLPLDAEVRDYALRVLEALQILEAVERRSQLDILNEVTTTYSDIVSFRSVHPESEDGSIPLEEGVSLLQSARDLLMSVASATVSPRSYFPTRKPTDAVNYVDRLRLGQSARGSYILNVYSRVPPALTAYVAAAPEHRAAEPFERQVTLNLVEAMWGLKEATERASLTGTFEHFEHGVPYGVNANTCDAVRTMLEEHDLAAPVEVGVAFSRTRPAQVRVPTRVAFTPDSAPILEEASRIFKERSPLEEAEVVGAVVKLDRPEGAPVGRVTVVGTMNGVPRNVRVELSEALYDVAIAAHQGEVPIECHGVVVKEGRSYVMRQPTDFQMK